MIQHPDPSLHHPGASRRHPGPALRHPGPALRHPDFPLRKAVTRGFTLGRARSVQVAPDGSRVLFLRSSRSDDPVHALWCYDLEAGEERILADPRALVDEDEHLTPEEARRRERAREQSRGIVGYATDRACQRVVYQLSGRVFTTDVRWGETDEVEVCGSAFDPRPDPTGRRVAYVTDGDLYVVDLHGHGHRVVGEQDGDVSWGIAEFVAAEEMDRLRGYWWSPDGSRIVAARVDTSPVAVWYLSDPSEPGTAPTATSYPAAGQANAEVTLAIFDVDEHDPGRVDVTWDRSAFPYLGRVSWSRTGGLAVVVVSRRQDRLQVLRVSPEDGSTAVVAERAADDWVELLPGVPAWLDDGRLVDLHDVVGDGDPDGTRRLLVDSEPVTPPGLMVSAVVEVNDDSIWFLATHDPREAHLYRLEVGNGEIVRVTDAPGLHGASIGGDVVVLSAQSAETAEVPIEVRRDGRTVARLADHAEDPPLPFDPHFLELTDRQLPAVLLLPHDQGDGPWPVIVSPYGGPHVPARSARSVHRHLEKQWLAEQGFAVLVVDGAGTPDRSVRAEREIRFDLATPVLRDQVDALHDAASRYGQLDLSRVAIRGWSFGGYLAALAALRRPDVFHAAVVGAPVTDWHLYDTYYTERYLGLPQEQPEAYRRSSLVDAGGDLIDAVEPADGRYPGMLLIHGLADDNVVAAHTVRLSGALLAAGRPHEVLPLSGVTHMTPQAVISANLLRLELDFIRRHLASRD